MTDLENKFCKLLQELQQKRADYEELQQSYNRELLRQEELKLEIEGLKTEALNSRTLLELTNKALHKCEENLGSCRETSVKHRLSLEASNKTLDLMRDQATESHIENAKLKKQVDDLERDIQLESSYRESCDSKLKKLQITLDSVTRQMRNKEKDFRDLERHSKNAISIGNKSKLLVNHKEIVINQLKTNNLELSQQLVTLNSENRSYQEKLIERKAPEQQYVKEIIQEWQNSVSEMKTRAANHEKECETLHLALENALSAQLKHKNLEEAAVNRAKELDLKLQQMEKSEMKNRTDCSVQTDLNISIDVACQTTGVDVKGVLTQTDQETPTKVNNTYSGATSQLLLTRYQLHLEPKQVKPTENPPSADEHTQLSSLQFAEMPTQINNKLHHE